MSKLRTILELIFQRGETNIYRRILRTALWGSCVTFMVMGVIFLVSIFILHNELHEQGRKLYFLLDGHPDADASLCCGYDS